MQALVLSRTCPAYRQVPSQELPRIAPWVYDKITVMGVQEVRHAIADLERTLMNRIPCPHGSQRSHATT